MSSNKAKQDACYKANRLSRLACSVLASTALISFSAYAGPQGGSIAAGQGNITSSQYSTLIHQHTNSLIIDWQSFNISVNELVRFDQPSSRAVALNRIQDQKPSEIFGSLQANGLILLMNPNGILFGESASVQVGGLVATNLGIDADLFMRGDYNLESLNAGGGMIINRGLIAASTGGVSLISDTGVINEGKILASYGSINLATAKTATLDFDGDKLLQLSVDGEVLRNALSLDAAIANSGELIAEGGDVIISGKVARDVFTNVVNNTGIIKATRIVNEGGVIRLTGLSGDINNSGTLDVSGIQAGDVTVTAANVISSGLVDASATEGNGGNITLQSSGDTFLQGDSLVTVQADEGTGGIVQVLGERVGVFDNSVINASGLTGGGEILIGGDFQGKNASIQNASQTFVGADTSVIADGITRGDGGKVIIWADNTTQYYGDISVKGGVEVGDGGLVEVSGKQFLSFDGAVDVTATNGTSGKILLDPDNIIIENGNGSSDDGQLGDNVIAFADGGTNDYNISEQALEALIGNIVLQAEVDITLENLSDNLLDLAGVTGGQSVVFQAGNDIVFSSSNDEIRTNGGDILLEANSPDAASPDGSGILDIGNLNSQGGNITLLGTNFTINSTVEAGSGDIFISTSDGSAIDLDSFFSQNEYNRLNTTGNLTIGMATTAGTNGLGAGSVDVYASSLSLSQDRTINPGVNATVNLVLDTGNLIIDSGDTLTVGADLVIDTGGTVDINGNIVAGSNNVTIIASDIRGDGGSGQEISSAGTLTLTADVIGVTDSTFNITNVTTLVINDQGAGDIEINLNGGTGIELGVAANDLTATDLGSVTDFTYNNTFGSVSLGNISATGKNVTVNAAGDITDNTSSITAVDLTLSTATLDSAIGTNLAAINTTLSGSLSAVASNGAGGIYINQTGNLDIASINTGTGDLELTTDANITDSGTQMVGGAAVFTVGAAANITLNDMANNYGSTVTFNSTGVLNDVTFVDTTAYEVQASGLTLNGNLVITADGITQAGGALSVLTGTASFDAGGNVITLGNATNDFGGAVNLNNTGTNTVVVADANAIELGTVSVGDDTFTVNAGTDITSSGTQTVGGAATFNAGTAVTGNITLDDIANAYSSTVTFASASGLGNVTFVDTTAYDVQAGGLTVSGNLDITAAGITQTGGVLTVLGGTASFAASGANDIVLTDATNDFGGAVSLNTVTGNASIIDANTIDMGTSSVGGDLAVTAVAGAISQTGGTLSVTGTSSFNAAPDNDITLNQANTFGSTVNLSTSGTGNVSVTDADAIELGVVSVGTGTFAVTAATNITDLDAQAVNVNGAASFIVGNGGNIILDNGLNNYTSTVSFAPSAGTLNDVTFVNSATIDLQASTIGGNLSMTSVNGAIGQSGALNVAGTSSFSAALDNNITLTDVSNDFGGAVSLSTSGTGSVAVSDANAIDLGTVSVDTGTFTVTAVTDITDSGTQAVNGAASFIVGNGGNIILNDGLNNYSSTVSFAPSAGTLNNVTFVNDATIDLQASTIGGNLSMTSVSGAIGQSGALSVTGTSSFSAALDNNITLADVSNDFGDAVSLSTSGTGSVAVSDANAIDLGTVSVDTGTLTVTAGTDITDSGTQTVNGAATFNAGNGGNIILNDASNSYTSTVTFNSAGTLNNLTFVDTTAYDVQGGGLSIGGNLAIAAAGITQTGGALSVAGGTSSFTSSGANDITLTDATNDFGGTVNLNTGTGNASITDANAIDLAASNVGGDLTVIATTGSITGNSGGTITVGGNASLTANASGQTIGSALTALSTAISGSLTANAVTGTGGVYISDTGSLEINIVDAGTGNVELTSGGTITDAAGADTIIDVRANALTIAAVGGTGVDATDALNLDVSSLIITPSPGDFFLTVAGALSLDTVTVGSIDLFAGGDLTVVGNVTTTSGDLALSSGGTLSIAFGSNLTFGPTRPIPNFDPLKLTLCPFCAPDPFDTVTVFENTFDSVTLDSSAGTGNIILTADNIDITNGTPNSYSGPVLILPNGFGNDYFYDELITPDATLNAGTNSVIFDTNSNTGTNQLALGTMLTQGEINRVTAASTIQFGTLNNTDGIQLAANLDTSALTTNTVLLTSGSVTTLSSLFILDADNLSLTASTGIGVDGFGAGSPATAFGLQSNSISAVNNTSGDLFLTITDPGGGVTLGGLGTITNNAADSAIGITSTGNLIVDTDFSVAGNGTISLDASGTITRTDGTVIANTVNLGTGGTTTGIGTSGSPVLVSSPNINARTTGAGIGVGNIFLQNNQAVDLVMNATGNVEFTNTIGGISSALSTILGLTDGITVGGDLTLRADDMEFIAGTTVSGANINLYTQSATAGFLLGDNTDMTNRVELDETELQRLSSTGVVTIGENGVMTGDIILGGAVDLIAEFFGLTLTTTGTIDTPSVSNVLTLGSGEVLTLDALNIGVTNPVETVASNLTITTNNGNVNIENGTDLNDLILNAGIGDVDIQNAGYVQILTTLTAGSFSFDIDNYFLISGAVGVNASVGDIVIIVSPTGDFDSIFLDDMSFINATGDLTLTADRMLFDFGGVTTLTGSNITINPFTTSRDVVLGSLATNLEDSDSLSSAFGLPVPTGFDSTLNLTSTELAMLDSSGEVTIGGAGYTGNVDIGQDIVDLSAENFDFTITTNGTIDDSTGLGNPLILNPANLLTLNAGTGIGNTNAITFTANRVSAINANSGTLGSLALAPTGSITLGGPGITIDQQEVGGALSIISGGDIIIAADVSVSGGGASTVSLDTNGTITRTAGTVIAQTINIGQASSPVSVGASGTPVLLDGESLNVNSSGDVFIGNANTATTTLNSTTANLNFNQAGAGDLLLGNISSVLGIIDITTSGGSDINGVAGQSVNGATVAITSDGAIGSTTPLTVDATTSLSLTSNGNAAAGDINVISNLATTPFPTLMTNGAGVQTISLAAPTYITAAPINMMGNNLLLNATSGVIELGANVNVNNLYLVSSDTVSQTGGAITTDSLLVRSSGAVTLSGNNNVTTIAGDVSGLGADFTFNDINALVVGSVQEPGAATPTDGITTNGGNINLTTGGMLSQTATGVISGALLTTNTTGGAILNSATNAVNSINAIDTAGGNIALLNGVALDVANINTLGDALLDATSLTDSGQIVADLLTTVTSNGSVLNTSVFVTDYNGTDTGGNNIILVNNGGLNLTGINTTGVANISATTGLTASGVITAGLLAASTDSGGIILNNASNNVGAFSAINTDGSNISLVDTGSLELRGVLTGGNITITSGSINQSQDVGSFGGGNITVTANTGGLTMANGSRTLTPGGTITYNAVGDVNLSLLSAAPGVTPAPASVGTISVTSTNGSLTSVNQFIPSVRANTVNLDAAVDIGRNNFDAFVLSSDIQGQVTLNYLGQAFLATFPGLGVQLNIVDFGTGFINAGAARSAGTQRSQNTGLEDIGFIDLALFSDINLFVVDGIGIKLPASQSDVAPTVIEDLPILDRIPVKDDDEEKRRQLNVSTAY